MELSATAGTGIIEKEKYSRAVKIHSEIMANGEMAAYALVEVCKNLKVMRDEALFSEFGYSSFDDYCEKMAGIKARQAYTYISTYERLGNTVLQSNAELGITKLDLLAQLPPTDRSDIIESGELAGMSVKELKEAVKQARNYGEQLSLLEQEKEELKIGCDDQEAANRELQEKYNQVTTELKQLQEDSAKPAEPIAVSDAERERISADIKKQVEREFKEKQKAAIEKEIQKAKEKAEKEKADAIAQAKKEAAEAAMASVSERVKAAEAAIQDANERARELEKQVKLSDASSTTATIYFNSMRDDYKKMVDVIAKMEPEQQSKFKGAVSKALKMLLDDLSNSGGRV